MNKLIPLRMAITAGAVLLLAACAATTNVDYRPGFDFSAIRTIAPVAPGKGGSQDPRISGPLIEARVNRLITANLEGRGYRVAARDAQARLTWKLTTRSGVESNDSGISFGYGSFGRHSAVGIGYGFPLYDVDSYDDAVLTIDILDPVNGGLLWRGSAHRRLEDGMTPDKLTALMNNLVSEVLGQFPPGSGR